MYVVHIHWQLPATPAETGAVLLWAEDASSMLAPKVARQGRKVLPHPFCATDKTLRQLVHELTSMSIAGKIGQLALLLPTTKWGPLPSPHLVHDWTVDAHRPTLAAWQISGLWLTPAAALALLINLPSLQDLPPHVRLGDDGRYWEVVTNLILENLAQQKVLPTLSQVDAKQYQARWQPVLDGPRDGPRLARLLTAMPPVCRSAVQDGAGAPTPRLLLDTFLNTMTDALARQWGQAGQPSFTFRQSEPVYQWLRALFSTEPTVNSTAPQLQRLQTSLRAWLRNLHMAGDRHFRIAFRLEAPQQQSVAPTSGDWMLHFLLQARDDPSLLVVAEQVWQSRGSVLTALDRRFEQPQEKLLAGLGYAARLFEPLQRSLQSARPTMMSLSADEAFAFLRTAAPVLEESGFGVLVPPWWNKPGTRLGVRLHMQGRKGASVDAVASGGMNFENLVSYRWALSLGDTTLTRAEFDALVALKSPLVQIRGQWVQLDPQQIEAAIRFWNKHELAAEVDLQEALRLGLSAEQIDGLQIDEVQFEGWLADWMARFTHNEPMTVLPQPATLHAQLRPYQQYGYSWLDFLRRWKMGACLADDMGLGKTIQTLAMLLREKELNGHLPGPVLLVAPTSVVTNWAKEINRFAPDLAAFVHQGMHRLRGEAFVEQVRQMEIVLTSYPLVRRDEATLNQVDWFGVILDEAQNIKNAETKQARALRQLPATFRLALTGTPVENRLSELWSIMHFLNPGYLGSRQTFRRRFALPIERYENAQAAQQLRKLVSPFILRRVKTDPTVIQDLPDKQETKVYCHLSPEQATLYEAVVREALQQIESAEDDLQRRGQVLAMLMKLKQICNHPAQFLHQIGDGSAANDEEARSGKLGRLVEMLEEIMAVNDRILIFTQFAEMGHLLRRYLQQRLSVPTQFLHGGTPARQRTTMIERFQDDPDGPPIFILSLKAGGTGLNLTRANHVFHFDRWWNPAVENQATDRAFRIGQQRNVQVHKFVCVGTLEEKIDDMIESKKALAESVVGSGEHWLTEMSTKELRAMVALRREMLE
ncbi:MAG: DEAD/DEAH box helicase [Chloroflexi bacterium]|nr:DEAD/DEAH box helicase [Chloroflexota bacterium]